MNQVDELPPRLKAATLAAADNLAALAHSEGLKLGGPRGGALPDLEAILYLIKERCIQAEQESLPGLGDQTITPAEIATVLETIAQVMVSEEMTEFVGYNASWFSDAADVVERIGYRKGTKQP